MMLSAKDSQVPMKVRPYTAVSMAAGLSVDNDAGEGTRFIDACFLHDGTSPLFTHNILIIFIMLLFLRAR